MHHLDRASDRERRAHVAAAGCAEREHQHRAQTFAAGSQAVVHCLQQTVVRHGRVRKIGIERRIGERLIFLILCLIIHALFLGFKRELDRRTVVPFLELHDLLLCRIQHFVAGREQV